MDKRPHLPNHLISAINLLLASPSSPPSWESFLPHECLYMSVRHVVDIADTYLPNRNRCNEETALQPQQEAILDEKTSEAPTARRPDPLARNLFAAAAMFAFLGTCIAPQGYAWDVLLSANALLCWLLRSRSRREESPRSVHADTRAQRVTAELLTAFVSHAVVLSITTPFLPDSPLSWLQLVGLYLPLAGLTALASRSDPETQRHPWFEVSCYILQCLLLYVLWLGAFSAVANLHLVEGRADVLFAGLDRTQVAAVAMQGWCFLVSVVRRSHAAERGTWAGKVGAGVYTCGALFYYCYLARRVEDL